MPDENNNQPNGNSSRELGIALQKLGLQIHAWIKETNPEVHATIEPALESATKIAGIGFDGLKGAMEMVAELIHEITGVESFGILPKSGTALAVDIVIKRELTLPFRRELAPFTELTALNLGKRIRFEALIDKSKKGLRLSIHEGFGLTIVAPLLGEQTVPVKGSGLLTRNERGELVLVISTPVPGSTSTAEVAFPITNLLAGVRAIWKSNGR